MLISHVFYFERMAGGISKTHQPVNFYFKVQPKEPAMEEFATELTDQGCEMSLGIISRAGRLAGILRGKQFGISVIPMKDDEVRC